MSKSLLVIDTPESCEECRCSTTVYGKLLCPPRNIFVIKGERDCSCPLVAVPQSLPYSESKGIATASYIEGWNDCIAKMLGE